MTEDKPRVGWYSYRNATYGTPVLYTADEADEADEAPWEVLRANQGIPRRRRQAAGRTNIYSTVRIV